jgi:phenylalanyl-tRNA synthetase alpha chain
MSSWLSVVSDRLSAIGSTIRAVIVAFSRVGHQRAGFLILESAMDSSDTAAAAIAELEALESAGLSAFQRAATSAEVEAARIEFLGQRQGRIKAAQERIKALDAPAKRLYGQRFNAAKSALEAACESAKVRVERPGAEVGGLDVSRPGCPRPKFGHRHPLTQTADELIDLFGRFGFSVARGPEVEDVFHNFEALNIPATHPARDPADNFYLSNGTLLRTQTSTVQIRVMESQPPPVRVIAIGRVYRPDAVDATHSFMFHQIEGLMVDRGVTMADLKTVLRLFAESYLGADVKIRFRPSFFPFTEPSVEVDMLWHGGERWVEMGGAGMVDPNVFRAVGYDPEEVTGFAFGLGIERLCMRRHGIDDIRLLYQNDARFLSQF